MQRSPRMMLSDSLDSITNELPAKLYELEHELRDAIRAEDYKRAASLRDLTKTTRQQDAVSGALDEIDAAIRAEDFDRAALARRELKFGSAIFCRPLKDGWALKG